MMLQDYQVLQRDADGMARLRLDGSGETIELPVGGPYDVGGATNVLVGDLWVLAGQSNMEGVGDLVEVETPSPFVHSYQSREQWAVAQEPLHWLGESPRPVHHLLMGLDGVPDHPMPRDPLRTKGSGLGLTFARLRYARTGVPVGLIPSAHGGTSMQQWDPALRDQGGRSLYGATLQRVQQAGGKVAGILWYQGESDASPVDLAPYSARMAALVNAFRRDFDQPDLPFYYVQVGRFVSDATPESIFGWNGIRDVQRTWARTMPRTAAVSAIDLDLDDLIHVGTQGLKRLGTRLADVADGYLAPDLAAVDLEDGGLHLRVTFANVRGGVRSPGRPPGFSLRHAGSGAELPMIYKVSLQGDAALLHLTSDLLPADTVLWYGWGLDPYCNLTDAQDAAIPAFGPVAVI